MLLPNESGPAPGFADRWRAVEAAVPRPVRIGILLVVLLGAGALFVLDPQIAANTGALDTAHPLHTPFQIRNRGFLTVREVQLQCTAHAVEFGGSSPVAQTGATSARLPVTTVKRAQLAPGESMAVSCDQGWENPAGDLRWADLDLNVCLKPYPLIDYISVLRYRFVGESKADGAFEWSQRTVRRDSIAWLLVRHESDVQECVWAE